MKKLFLYVLILLFFAVTPIYADYVKWVYVAWTDGGVARYNLFYPGSSQTIHRDPGTPVNIRVYKLDSGAPASVNFFLHDWSNNISLESGSVSGQSYDFNDSVGPLDAQVWAGINNYTDVVEIYVINNAATTPDLIVTSIQVNDHTNPLPIYYVGDSLTIESNVWNQGQSTAGASNLGYYIGTSASDLSTRWGNSSVGTLGPGVGTPKSSVYWLQERDLGTRYIVLKADYLNAVDEGNAENNNISSFGPFAVAIPAGNFTGYIEPAGVHGTARWRLTSGPDTSWKVHSATIPDIPEGTYTITFNDVAGFLKPADHSITIERGETTTYTGTYAQTYALDLNIANIPGGSSLVPSTYGRVDLFNSSWEFMRNDATDSNGVAEFLDLPAGTYFFRVYVNYLPANMGEEYWGWGSASVPAQGPVSFVRNWPYFDPNSQIVITNAVSGDVVHWGDTLPAGISLKFDITVRNSTAGSLDSYIGVGLAPFGNTAFVPATSAVNTLPGLTAGTYSVTIGPVTEQGDLYYAGRVHTNDGTGFVITDTAAFNETQVLHVRPSYKIPPSWGAPTSSTTYNLFGQSYRVNGYMGDQYLAVLDASDNVVTDIDTINALMLFRQASNHGILAGTDNSALAAKWIHDEDPSGQLTRHCSDYYAGLTEAAKKGAKEYWDARIAVSAAGTAKSIYLAVGGAAIGLLIIVALGSNPIGWAIGLLIAGGGIVASYYSQQQNQFADKIGDEFVGVEYRSYLAANEYLKRYESGIYDDEILENIQELATTSQYAADTLTGLNNAAEWLNYGYPIIKSLVDNTDPMPMFFTKSALIVAAIPLTEFLDRTEEYVNIGYWRERSEFKHLLMLNLLANHISKTYSMIDHEIPLTGSQKNVINEIDKLLKAISLFEANLHEWDLSAKIRNYQLLHLDNKQKVEKYQVAQEDYEIMEQYLYPDSLSSVQAWDTRDDSFISDYHTDLDRVDAGYQIILNIASFINLEDQLLINWGSSIIKPVPYSSSSLNSLMIRNNSNADITGVSLSVIDSDGLDISITSGSQNIAAWGNRSFAFSARPATYDKSDRKTKFRVNWVSGGIPRSQEVIIPIQVTIPFQIPYVRPGKASYEVGETCALDIFINALEDATLTIRPRIYRGGLEGYTYPPDRTTAIDFGDRSVSVTRSGSNQVHVEAAIPANALSGFYTIEIEMSYADDTLTFSLPRLFSILPHVISGSISGFNYVNCTIITSVNDEEIASRISSALNNVEVLPIEGLTAGQLLPIMQRNNLILIGGHISNELVNELIRLGKIAANQWIAPGEASLEVVDDPFPGIAPPENRSLVIAGFTKEDTYLAGLRFVEYLTTIAPNLKAPTLQYPANLSNGEPTARYFYWSDTNSNPSESGSQLRIKPNGGNYQYYESTSNIYFVYGLLEGVTYYWNVRAIGDGVTAFDSEWANSGVDWSFTTALESEPDIEIRTNDEAVVPDEGTYDFGTFNLSGSYDMRMYIRNYGTATLVLTGNPYVSLSGEDADQFEITSQPPSRLVPPGQTIFYMAFRPTSPGLKNAVLNIPSSDPDEPEYHVHLRGEVPLDDRFEDNDEMSQAAEVSTGTQTGLELLDSDWYKVLVPAGRDLVVSGNSNEISYLVSIYDSAGNMLSESYGGGVQRVNYSCPMTEYIYIHFESFFRSSGAYTLTVQISQGLLGSISGRVYRQNGKPILGADIVVYGPEGGWERYVETDASGEYHADSIYPDDYRISFGHGNGEGEGGTDYVLSFFDHKDSWESADIVHISSGQELSGIDCLLAEIYGIDFVGTWPGLGVRYLNSDTDAWVRLASSASQITLGNLDGDREDDLIGIWPAQGGVWTRYSSDGSWHRIASTAKWITAGDMDADGICDLVGIWAGQGTFYYSSDTQQWVRIASEATQIALADMDGDGMRDLVGIWPSQGGVWIKYSSTLTWSRIASTADWIACGDMTGDGLGDLIGVWNSQNGVYYRDSADGSWHKLASAASKITAGDLDGDYRDDLIGIWDAQGGVWIKYSSDNTWEHLAPTADWIAAGKIRSLGYNEESPTTSNAASPTNYADLPMKNESAISYEELGPGSNRFVFTSQKNLVPTEIRDSGTTAPPGPLERGFTFEEGKNLMPGSEVRERKHTTNTRKPRK